MRRPAHGWLVFSGPGERPRTAKDAYYRLNGNPSTGPTVIPTGPPRHPGSSSEATGSIPERGIRGGPWRREVHRRASSATRARRCRPSRDGRRLPRWRPALTCRTIRLALPGERAGRRPTARNRHRYAWFGIPAGTSDQRRIMLVRPRSRDLSPVVCWLDNMCLPLAEVPESTESAALPNRYAASRPSNAASARRSVP